MRRSPKIQLGLLFLAFGLLAFRAVATTYYVDVNSTNPAPPYTNWSTASTDIQSAVGQTTNGDTVLVNPGDYQSSGYVAPDAKLSCVSVTNAITLLGFDGSAQTVIDGGASMRCIYLAAGCAMAGFTLTNGTVSGVGGGGVCCASNDAMVSCCILAGNTGGGGASSGTFSNCVFYANRDTFFGGGGASYAVLNNCLLVGNSAANGGGGAYSSTLNNCTFSNNVAADGGGAAFCILSNCFLTANYVYGNSGYGGGIYIGTAYNCVLSNNWAASGGGAAGSDPSQTVLINCTLVDNIVTSTSGNSLIEGGGAYGCMLTNCLIENNSISDTAGGLSGAGGGVCDCELDNCLLISNSVYAFWLDGQTAGRAFGGGAASSTLNDCKIYGNLATNNLGDSYGGGVDSCTLQNCIISNNFAYYGGEPLTKVH